MSFYEMKKALVALLAAVFVLCAGAVPSRCGCPRGMASAETGRPRRGTPIGRRSPQMAAPFRAATISLSGDVTLTENLTIGGAR